MRVGISGMGRIGRLALRAAMGAAGRGPDDPRAGNRLDVVHLNEIKGGAATTAHLLEFDSVQGRWRGAIAAEGEKAITIGDRRMGFSAHASPADIPWGDLGVDVVLECTGKFLTPATLEGISSAAPSASSSPRRSRIPRFSTSWSASTSSSTTRRHPIVTAASCTTNCLAPVVKVVHEAIGIERGQITTIHDPTNTNVVVDAPHKDLRRARSAMLSLQPTTTGSATAIALIYPELKGRLDGHAVRAPVLNASLTDCVFQVKRPTSAAEVNDLFKAAARARSPAFSASSRCRWSRPTMPATPARPSSTGPRPWSPTA
jgi:glyceraldehyde 3-phosphate dehydrogenase